MVSNEEIMEAINELKTIVDNHSAMLGKIAEALDANSIDTDKIKGVIVKGKTLGQYAIEFGMNVFANKL